MPKMSVYVSKETVKARKVTDKYGEDIVTALGPVHAEKGSYVVEAGEDGAVRVVEGAVFESVYKPRSTPAKRPSPARVPGQPRTASKPASERVKSKTGK